jgi:hypothetical protein
LAATRGCILEPARIWQPPQQGDITNTFSHHRYWQSKITFIDKLARITSSFKLLSSGHKTVVKQLTITTKHKTV